MLRINRYQSTVNNYGYSNKYQIINELGLKTLSRFISAIY
jgi:hypothetical protein